MNFDALLQYQLLDAKKMGIEDLFQKANSVIQYNKANAFLRDTRERFKKLKIKYAELSLEINNIEKNIEEISNEIADSENMESSYSSSEEMTYPIGKLNSLLKKMEESENALIKIKSNMQNIEKEIQEVFANAKKGDAALKSIEASYTADSEKREKILNDYTNQQKELEKSIDPELLEKYKNQANGGKVKVVFEANPKGMTCPNRLCYKAIENTLHELKNPGDFVICPECFSILIYK